MTSRRSLGISPRCGSTSCGGTRNAPGTLVVAVLHASELRASMKNSTSPASIHCFSCSTVTLGKVRISVAVGSCADGFCSAVAVGGSGEGADVGSRVGGAAVTVGGPGYGADVGSCVGCAAGTVGGAGYGADVGSRAGCARQPDTVHRATVSTRYRSQVRRCPCLVFMRLSFFTASTRPIFRSCELAIPRVKGSAGRCILAEESPLTGLRIEMQLGYYSTAGQRGQLAPQPDSGPEPWPRRPFRSQPEGLPGRRYSGHFLSLWCADICTKSIFSL